METELQERSNHWASICKNNAAFHRAKWHETKDRYHLGQWKAWARMALRLRNVI